LKKVSLGTGLAFLLLNPCMTRFILLDGKLRGYPKSVFPYLENFTKTQAHSAAIFVTGRLRTRLQK
jgi:hypothetical protein